ncbi:hypothetical protein [Streptomyces sp. NBC_01353]|uniref:hypothetical protein n=1 Tax=Streptomyces sp. NBC_01353 TaxID=2903835 RepID=UPI002E371576|nr:hypothetical protein [Streptomyces sp. NBC_01353]
MTIQRPGLPGDLPSPELLWARWALVAVLEATSEAEESTRYRTGTWIDEEGLHLDDCGCTWWTFSRVGEGRYVLFGEDESSGVKWHRTPIDMLAGGPDWLPYEELRDRLEGNELGCVYWYENGAWARAPYPDDLGDDGLDCGMSRFVDRDDALSLLDEHVRHDAPGAEILMDHAERYRLTAELLESYASPADGSVPDLPAMGRALRRAELTPRTATAG